MVSPTRLAFGVLTFLEELVADARTPRFRGEAAEQPAEQPRFRKVPLRFPFGFPFRFREGFREGSVRFREGCARFLKVS